MNEKIIFFKPEDLCIIENDNELILRKGFLHINEITIDKSKSSQEFLRLFKLLNENGKISIDGTSFIYDDFIQLLKFGFINIKSNSEFLIIANKHFIDIFNSTIKLDIPIKSIEDIFDTEDFVTLDENKDTIKIEKILSKYKERLSNFNHLYFVEKFCNINILRGFNKLMNILNKESTIGFIDNKNIYLTGIKPNYTGCYECLENNIISKFDDDLNKYIEDYNYSNQYKFDLGDISIICGLIVQDIDNITRYKYSSLTGNVLHFYSPNFEYAFDANRRSLACTTCSRINNITFKEQNIKSVNVIKEVISNDKN